MKWIFYKSECFLKILKWNTDLWNNTKEIESTAIDAATDDEKSCCDKENFNDFFFKFMNKKLERQAKIICNWDLGCFWLIRTYIFPVLYHPLLNAHYHFVLIFWRMFHCPKKNMFCAFIEQNFIKFPISRV